MDEESDPVSAALMHLFYYQQGLFTDEVENSALQVGGSPASRQAAFMDERSPKATASTGQPQLRQVSAPMLPRTSSGQSATALQGGGTLRDLRARRDELKWRLNVGVLRLEKEALASQVAQSQQDFVALQDEFKEAKSGLTERVASLEKVLEAQQAVTAAADRRVICNEDLVRFYEEQRRIMASHWKAQCQMKDERIRYLNLQLTDYTIDWQHLGLQKQTEASLTHEFQCLKDRHDELRADCERRDLARERLDQLVAEAKEEVGALEAATEEARGNKSRPLLSLRKLEAENAGLLAQLELLTAWCRKEGNEAPDTAAPKDMARKTSDQLWPHDCIWRDELDVRERQLEKITVQLDRTNNALHVAQAELAKQRARHDEMKGRHREAECELREGERRRGQWQRQCLELRRAQAELRQALEASGSQGGTGATTPTSPPRATRPGTTESPAASVPPVKDRLAAIRAETRRRVVQQHGVPPFPPLSLEEREATVHRGVEASDDEAVASRPATQTDTTASSAEGQGGRKGPPITLALGGRDFLNDHPLGRSP